MKPLTSRAPSLSGGSLGSETTCPCGSASRKRPAPGATAVSRWPESDANGGKVSYKECHFNRPFCNELVSSGDFKQLPGIKGTGKYRSPKKTIECRCPLDSIRKPQRKVASTNGPQGLPRVSGPHPPHFSSVTPTDVGRRCLAEAKRGKHVWPQRARSGGYPLG